jgi:DHA1 family bicyclomycin/chloramphenicol resistance-like MFS transporter
MLDEFPQARGSASSVQNFVALLGNAAISGLLAPALGFSTTAIAAGSLTLLTVGAVLWRWHLAVGGRAPEGSPDAAAYEPLEDL